MSFESDLQELRNAQPAWYKEGVGVKGNAVDFQREQARVDWPGATLTRRPGRDLAKPAKAGAPDHPESVPAA